MCEGRRYIIITQKYCLWQKETQFDDPNFLFFPGNTRATVELNYN